MHADDELLDLVDETDNVIGTIWRSQTDKLHEQNRGFLRAAEILVRNRNGQLWIPRRQMHKRIAPGGLDYSTSGHVASGETYVEAAVREVKEELNLDLEQKSLKFLHKFPPIGEELAYIRSVYIYNSDETPKYNTDDFSGYEWLTPEELLKRLEAGESAKRSLKPTIAYLIKHKI